MTLNELNRHASEKCTGNEYVLKFVLVGDVSVGKTQLASRFMKDVFNQELQQTTGIEFATRDLSYYGNSTLKAQIWDSSGKEHLKSLTKTYFDSVVGAMIVYDVTNRSSFDNAMQWLKQIRKNTHANIAISLVANKSDWSRRRVVSTNEGITLAAQRGLDFIEVSALSGENVEIAFRRLIMRVAGFLPEGRRHNRLYHSSKNTDRFSHKKNDLESIHDGWIRVLDKHFNDFYELEYIWTGERISIDQPSPASKFETKQSKTCATSSDISGLSLKRIDTSIRSGATTHKNNGICTIS